MKMKILQAKAGKTGGPLTRSQGSRTMAGSGLLKELGEIVAGVSRARKVLLVSDVNTDRLYSRAAISSLENAGFQVRRYTLLPSEEQKNLTALQGIYEAMASFPLGRQDLILGLGGGAVCDLAGLAAATYMRGIDYAVVPASLAAQAGGAVGGKTAVNLPLGKDLIGAYHRPLAVITDTRLLRTLPRQFMIDGMAEVIKLACVKDRQLFQYLEDIGGIDALMGRMALGEEEEIEEIVWRCTSICHRMAEEDEQDGNVGRLLSFGHTVGQAIETCWKYTCCHGEAIAVGMAFAADFGEALKLTERGTAGRLKMLLHRFDLPDNLGDLAIACRQRAGSGQQITLRTEEFLPPKKNFGSFGSFDSLASFGSFGFLDSLQSAAGQAQAVSPAGLKGKSLEEALRETILLDKKNRGGQLGLVYITRIGVAGIYQTPVEALPLAELTEG